MPIMLFPEQVKITLRIRVTGTDSLKKKNSNLLFGAIAVRCRPCLCAVTKGDYDFPREKSWSFVYFKKLKSALCTLWLFLINRLSL